MAARVPSGSARSRPTDSVPTGGVRLGPLNGLDDRLTQLEDPNSALGRLCDREHDEYIVRRLMELIEPEFALSTWTSFRLLVLEERPAAGGPGCRALVYAGRDPHPSPRGMARDAVPQWASRCRPAASSPGTPRRTCRSRSGSRRGVPRPPRALFNDVSPRVSPSRGASRRLRPEGSHRAGRGWRPSCRSRRHYPSRRH